LPQDRTVSLVHDLDDLNDEFGNILKFMNESKLLGI
jgi:hypothetical protein